MSGRLQLRNLRPGHYRYLGDGIIAYRTKDKRIVYGIRWRERGRVRQRMIGPSKAQAREALKLARANAVARKFGLPVPDDKASITFARFATEYLEKHREAKRSWERDDRTVRKVLNRFLGTKPLDEISQLDAERIKQERVKECKPATVNRDIALLKHMMNMAVEWGYLSSNPVARTKRFKEAPYDPYVLSAEEEERLVEAAADHVKPVIRIAIHTGMRAGELLSLDWEQVDLVRGLITVRISKSGRMRRIDINDVVRATLLELGPKRQGPVFTYQGRPFKRFQRAFKTACENAGIPSRCRIHDLRHTFGSAAAADPDVPLPAIKDTMGHSSIQTTMRYVHMNAEARRRAVNALSKRSKSIRNAVDEESEVEGTTA